MNGLWISVRDAMHSQSVSLFLFPKFSASNDPTEFDGKLWSAVGGEGVKAMMKVS